MNIFIKFNGGIDPAQYSEICSAVGGVEIQKILKNISGLVIATAESEDAVAALNALPQILYAKASGTVKLCATPDDTNYGSQVNLDMINLPTAWDIETGDGSVIVGVLDSGIDIDHADLAGNLWVDGYSEYPNGGWDFHDDDENPNDGFGHGTSMAGIIGAIGNNATGIAGVCWDVQLMALKVSGDADGTIDTIPLVAAIDFAISHKVKILNMSMSGGSFEQAFYDALSAARDAGILCVVSAGNGGLDLDAAVTYPASYDLDNLLVVMGVENDGWPLFSSGAGANSNYGATAVDVAAPGIAYTTKNDGTYHTPAAGTSQSAAFVSGLAALMWSVNPNLRYLDVKRIITETATTPISVQEDGVNDDRPDGMTGLCVSDGIIDAYEAVLAASKANTFTAPLSEIVPGRTVQVTRIGRDDGKFDVEAEVRFVQAIEFESNPTGMYNVEMWKEVFLNAAALPEAADLLPSYEADGTQSISKQLTSPSGTGAEQLNENGTYSYAIVSTKLKVSEVAGVLGDTDGTDWHIVAMGIKPERNGGPINRSWQPVQRRISGELAYREDVDGNLTGIRWNNNFDLIDDNGGREYGDEDAPDFWREGGYEAKYGAWNADWEKTFFANYLSRNPDAATPNRDPREGSSSGTSDSDNPLHIGVCGAVFIANLSSAADTVQYIREGDVWFAQDTGKFYGLAHVRPDNGNGGGVRSFIGKAFRDLATGKIWVCAVPGGYAGFATPNWTEVTAISSHALNTLEPIDPDDIILHAREAYEDTTAASEQSDVGGKYHKTDTDKYYLGIADSGAFAVDFTTTASWVEVPKDRIYTGMPGAIALRGVGSYPCETPDYYIPILQELERNVRWDNDFDDDWEYGDTTAPAAWVSEGYDDIYGAWLSGWEKSFLSNYLVRNAGAETDPLIGSNSGLSNAPLYIGTEGNVFVAVTTVAANTITYAKENDVWFAQDTGLFYRSKASFTTPAVALNVAASFDVIDPSDIHKTVALGGAPGMPGVIALRGVGSYPCETYALVGVLDGSGGYALSTSARVSNQVCPGENPRLFEAFEAEKRYELAITLYSYFAASPHWLSPANRRIPLDWADFATIEESITDFLSTSTGTDYVQIPTEFAINTGESNFEIDHRFEEVGGGGWAAIKKIILRTEWEVDTDRLQNWIDQMQNTAHGEITGPVAKRYFDLTNDSIKPWAGSYKAL